MATPRVATGGNPLHARVPFTWTGSSLWKPPQATKAKRAGQKPLLDIRNITSPLAEEFCVDTQLRKEVEKKIVGVIFCGLYFQLHQEQLCKALAQKIIKFDNVSPST